MNYNEAKNDYYYWRNVAADYKARAAEPGLPDVLKRHYEAQRLAALKHAAVYRALMLQETTNV